MGKKRHYTVIFQVFVFLQFFNFINCRRGGPKDYNVFTRITSNWYFVIILALVFAVQCMANSPFAHWLFVTCRLSSKEFWSCIVFGSTSLLGSVLSKLTPERWLEKIPGCMKLDETKARGDGSVLSKAVTGLTQKRSEREEAAALKASSVAKAEALKAEEEAPQGDDDDFHA